MIELFARYEQLEKILLEQTPQEDMRRLYAKAAKAWRGLRDNYAIIAEAAAGRGIRAEALALYHGADEDLIRSFRENVLALEALQLDELDESAQRAAAALKRMRHAVYTAQFVLIAFGFSGCFAVARSISRPVQEITQLMSEMSAGKLDIDIPARTRRDEIGYMAATLDVFRRNSLAACLLAQENQRRTETLESLLGAFDASVSGVLRTMAAAATELENTAGEIGRAARDAGRRAQTAEGAAKGVSARLETSAAAAEKISASLGRLSRQIPVIAPVSGQAAAQAGSLPLDGSGNAGPKIAAALGEQAAATADISQNVARAALAARAAAESVAQTGTAIAHAESAAAQARGAARELSRESERLKDCVEQFFGELRRS